MSIFNTLGERIVDDYILVGITLDSSSSSNNYLAMKQLLDIGKRKIKNPDAAIANTDFDKASAGIVCALPRNDASLYDRYQFEVLWQKNSTQQYIPASVTKVLTVATGLPYIASLDERVTFIESDIQTGTGNIFNANDIITINDVLFGLMFWSSNTCAQAFSRYVGAKLLNDQTATPAQCRTAFIAEMNRIATDIGCANSSFDSPSGLSVTNLSTAEDLLKILIHASSFRELNDVWNKTTHTIKIDGEDPRTVTGSFSVTTNSTINADYHVFGGKPGGITVDGSNVYNLSMIAKPLIP